MLTLASSVVSDMSTIFFVVPEQRKSSERCTSLCNLHSNATLTAYLSLTACPISPSLSFLFSSYHSYVLLFFFYFKIIINKSNRSSFYLPTLIFELSCRDFLYFLFHQSELLKIKKNKRKSNYAN